MKKDKTKKIPLASETIRELNDVKVATAAGGGMCSLDAFTGTCPTQSQTCTKPP